jgi:RNA polymerase sigma-70 factor (ECF subfamily)
MAPEEFSARLQSASRSLWLIAAAVLGQRSDADDVLQEAAMIGLRKVAEFDPATNFAAWMGGIVRNVARNHARKRIRRQTSPADPGVIDQSRTAAEEPVAAPAFDRRGHLTADQPDFDDRVMHALEKLEDTARACLLLRTLKDLPYREISALLGIPEGTAMSHVHRARQFLRQQLSADATRSGE